jgi:hypothetical protein
MNGKSIVLKPKELAVIKKRFENTRVKNDFYKMYRVDAGCINRVLELGRCSTKTYNKLLLKKH